MLTKKETLSEGTWQRDRDQLVKMLGPHIGKRPITQIEAPQLLSILRGIESKGNHDTAHRVRAVCGRVFRYAIATGRATRDISADLKAALGPQRHRELCRDHGSRQGRALLQAIEGYDGQRTTHAALRIAPYVFVRPGELRAAEWSEFDLGKQA